MLASCSTYLSAKLPRTLTAQHLSVNFIGYKKDAGTGKLMAGSKAIYKLYKPVVAPAVVQQSNRTIRRSTAYNDWLVVMQ